MKRFLPLIVLAAATLFLLRELVLRTMLEFAGPLNGDAQVYFAVGRGILNGIAPYSGLFDQKPPGMFLFSALLMLLSGDGVFLAHLCTVIASWAIPVMVAAAVFAESRGRPSHERAAVTLLGFLFGGILAFHTMLKASGFQTEAFGSAFIVGYLFLLFHTPQPFSYWSIRGASFLMLCGFGLKEPFVFIALGGVLALRPDREMFVRGFLLPLGIALATGTVLLVLLGYIGNFFSLYLPEILGGRIQLSNEPMWMRIVAFWKLFDDTVRYALYPLLGFILLSLAAVNPLCGRQSYWSGFFLWRSFLLIGFVLGGSYLFFRLGMQFELLVPPFQEVMTAYVVLCVCIYVLLFFLLFRHQADLWLSAIVTVAALHLLILPAAVGNFLSQHYIFAVPVYVAFFWAWMRASIERDLSGSSGRTMQIFSGCVAALIVLTVFTMRSQDYAGTRERLLQQRAEEQTLQREAALIDQMLDACGIDRYLYAVTNGPWAFTKHSPLGPNFLRIYMFQHQHDPFNAFNKEFIQQLNQTAPVIIFAKEHPDLQNITGLAEAAARAPVPPCAAPFVAESSYSYIFRPVPSAR